MKVELGFFLIDCPLLAARKNVGLKHICIIHFSDPEAVAIFYLHAMGIKKTSV